MLRFFVSVLTPPLLLQTECVLHMGVTEKSVVLKEGTGEHKIHKLEQLYLTDFLQAWRPLI